MSEVLPDWLAGAKSLADVLRLAHQDQESRVPELLWKRCALAGQLDETLYARLAAGLPGAPSFEEFQDLAGVMATPSGGSLTDEVRDQYLKRWRREDPELAATSAVLQQYRAASGDSQQELRFLLLAQPQQGLERFLKLYQEADRGFDPGGCQALLRILRGDYERLSDDLRSTLNDREQYLQSRMIFADDYYRSVVYMQRQDLDQACDGMLDGSGPWMLNLFGQGGLGKTMFIRRLIAYQCIPEHERERTPVARADLDFVDLSLLAGHPWLLLLEAARQLRPQLPGSPFVTLLSAELLRLARLLREKGGAQRTQDRDLVEQSSLNSRQLIETLFVSGLGAKRALLIVDTLEELLLHRPDALATLLDVLFAVRDQCPGLRILLSGRYGMCDPERKALPVTQDLKDRLAREMTAVQIQPFDADQGPKYLRDIRHLEDSEVIQAIMKRSGGNPFELSLFADLTRMRPLLTVKDVEDCPDARLAYLVERVIDRMPDEPIAPGDDPDTIWRKQTQFAARWLVRYAVVPQELTFDFLKNVLKDFLESEISGKTQRDYVSLVEAGFVGPERWRRAPISLDEKALEDVWDELQKYVSSYNWIEGNADALQLHAEVVVPMRELLRQKPEQYPFYDQLHLAAALYFEGLAGPGSRKPGKYLGKALYHRYQILGREARSFWDTYLEECRAFGASAVKDLAESVESTRDYLDDERCPLPHFRTGSLVDRQTLQEAALESAHAAVLAWLRSLDPKPGAVAALVNERLDDWQHFGGTPEQARGDWLRLLEGAQAVFQRDAPRALQLLEENWIANSLEPEDKVAARLLLLRVFFAGTTEADWQYVNALSTGERHSLPTFPLHFLPAISGLNHVGRLTAQALDELGRACEVAIAKPADPLDASQFLQWFGDVAIANGQWSALQEYCRRAVAEPKRFPFPVQEQARDLLLHCLLDFRKVEEARRLVEESKSIVIEPASLSMQAELAAATFRFDQADELYAKAEQSLREMNLDSSAVAIRLSQTRMHLESMGQVRYADSGLASVGAILEPIHGLQVPLLRIQIEAAKGLKENARNALQESLDLLKKRRSLSEVHELVARATWLAQGLGEQRDAEDFLERLGKLALPSSRYAALMPFRTTSFRSPKPLVREFRTTLREPEDSGDWFQHNLCFASGCRFFGDRDNLEKSLRMGIARASGDPYALFAVLGLIGEELASDLPAPGNYLEQWRQIASQEPAHAAVAFLEEAERLYYRADFRQAGDLLQTFFSLAETALPRQQQWMRRALFLRARLLWRDGKQADTFGTLSEAVSMASELGDQPAVRSLEKILSIASELGNQPAIRSLETLEKILETGFVLSMPVPEPPKDQRAPISAPMLPDQCTITQIPYGLQVDLRIDGSTASSHAAKSPFAVFIAASFGDLYPPDLVTLLRQDPGSAQEALEEIVAPTEPLRSRLLDPGKSATRKLCLKMPRSGASSIPWELAWAGNPACLLYRSTNNSITPLPEWLDEAQGPPKIMIIQAGGEEERYSKRGYGLLGLPIEEFYREKGLRVETILVQDPLWEETRWKEALTKIAPSIIHITSPLRDSTQPREAFLEFGLGSYQTESLNRQLRPSVLADALERLPPRLPRPFVILDAYWDPEDHVRQVLLRNYFAASLFESVFVRGVLATGDYTFSEAVAFMQTMTKELARRPTLAEIYATISRRTRPLLPPALFTSYPDLRVF